jgi:hypothetical protein
MPRPTIEPITQETLPEFARFLAEHMPVKRTAQAWASGLRAPWSSPVNNVGFALRDEGRIVGGIGAFYGERIVRGRRELTCNITSWCVLDAYRQQSMRLGMSLIGQGGMTFTNFSPTKVVGATLKFLKFKELDDRTAVMPNLPWPGMSGGRVVVDPDEIRKSLEADALRAYSDHAGLPWLKHVLVGRPGHWCHVVYKRRSFKGLPSAHILHVGDPNLLATHFRRLLAHLLGKGIASTHVELRLLGGTVPRPHKVRSGFTPMLFLSTELAAPDIDYLYSETLALDL